MSTWEKVAGLAAAIVLSMLAVPSCAQTERFRIAPQVDGIFRTLNIPADLSAVRGASTINPTVWWSRDISQADTRYLRLNLSDIELIDGDFVLRFYDRNGGRIAEIERARLVGRTEYWTGILEVDYVLVTVEAPSRPRLRFKIGSIAYQRDGGIPESITVPDDRQHVAIYASDNVVSTAQKSVAKLSFVKDQRFYVCSGFMVSRDILVTNHHCVPDAATCASTVAIFGYQYDANGTLSRGTEFQCSGVERANYEYDVALLRMSGSPGATWGYLSPHTGGISNGQDLFIIQHPAGQPKQISKIGCRVAERIADGRAAQSDFSHLCDTLGGSSGSPVLNAVGRVVGLHHFGFADGNFWNQNRAVRVEHIAPFLPVP